MTRNAPPRPDPTEWDRPMGVQPGLLQFDPRTGAPRWPKRIPLGERLLAFAVGVIEAAIVCGAVVGIGFFVRALIVWAR